MTDPEFDVEPDPDGDGEYGPPNDSITDDEILAAVEHHGCGLEEA